MLANDFRNKDDFGNFIYNEKIDQELDAIPGIGETTISYFFMLAGDENNIKPDRHIKGFLVHRLGLPNNISNREAKEKLELILPKLQKNYKNLTLRSLDYLIWDFQRN